jgi:hypothetical protein
MNHDLKEIGQSLVEHAITTAEFSKQRGLTDELFPYIFQASRRMSTRAISAYLMEQHKVKLSAVTIAKALREADKHWLSLYDSLEPDARIVADAQGIGSASQVLKMKAEIFDMMSKQVPTLATCDTDQGWAKRDEYDGAVQTLWDEWFSFDDALRDTCLACIPDEPGEAEEQEEAK